jgi:hypothetical protein
MRTVIQDVGLSSRCFCTAIQQAIDEGHPEASPDDLPCSSCFAKQKTIGDALAAPPTPHPDELPRDHGLERVVQRHFDSLTDREREVLKERFDIDAALGKSP